MKVKLKTVRLSREARQNMNGYWFVLPWVIGFLTFFLLPMLESLWYSFSAAGPLDEMEGLFSYLKETFTGIQNYNHVWKEDPNFTNNLVDSLSHFVFFLPIIVILSLISAVVLNQKFHGRMLARAIFFLPVIIASGVVMGYLNGDSNAQQLLQPGQQNEAMYTSFSFADMLTNLGLPTAVTAQLNTYIASIFSLVWSSGVQTILFLAGLQSISEQYYEVARVEGGTAWETFWYVTFPMLTNVLVLNIIYTCIDLFTDTSNAVMKQAYSLIEKNEYNTSAAIMWSFFAILGTILIALLLIFRKRISRNSFS